MINEDYNRTKQVISKLNSTLDSIGSELEKSVEGYSQNKLLSLGKEALRDSSYLYAELYFEKLGESSEFEEIASLYEGLSATLSDCEYDIQLKGRYHGLRDNSGSFDSEKVIENAVSCMMQSTAMYAENTLSAEELFEIELYIDRIPFNGLQIPLREEFNRIYSKFKKRCLDVFLGETQ